ncbi:hypothetical protein [Thalassospira sp. CH_XMU1420-2]|uniref:hypothetical protein n=1 Tax=Thalassospira sp. CH_XMU1420-2 TaxID=3107769 RepID=UPI00300A926A
MHVSIITDASYDNRQAGFGMHIKLSEPVHNQTEFRFHGAISDINSSTDSEAVAVTRALRIAQMLCSGKKLKSIEVITDSDRTVDLINLQQRPNHAERELTKLVFSCRQQGIKVNPKHQRSHIAINGCWNTQNHDWCDSAARAALKSVREIAVC